MLINYQQDSLIVSKDWRLFPIKAGTSEFENRLLNLSS